MAFTVNTELNRLNPVRNAVLFGVESDSYITEAASVAVIEMTFEGSDIPVNNDTIEFLLIGWTDYIAFTFKDVVDADLAYEQILSYSAYGGSDLDEWITLHVLPKVRGQYYLFTQFDIEYLFLGAHHGLRFTAREVGFNNGMADVNHAGYLFHTLTEVDGVDQSTEENFKLVTQLWVEEEAENENYILRLEEYYPPDAEGGMEVDVSEVLRAYLAPTMPEPDTIVPLLMQASWTRFFVRVSELYGSDPEVRYFTEQSETQRAYLAGRREVDRLTYVDWEMEVCPVHGLIRFLTAWPHTDLQHAKKVTPEQREFLAFVWRRDEEPTMTEANVLADIHYTDGTSALGELLSTIGAFTWEHRPFLLPVGVKAMGLDDVDPLKTILYYTIYLTDQEDTVRSEVRYFQVDYRHHENYRQLHYFNSQGGVDTIALLGERVNKPEADMERSERFSRRSTTLEDARNNVALLRSFRDGFEVGTAYHYIDDLEGVRDLVGSERIVERVGEEHWPVELLTDKGPPSDEAEGLQSFVVKYRYALTNNAT